MFKNIELLPKNVLLNWYFSFKLFSKDSDGSWNWLWNWDFNNFDIDLFITRTIIANVCKIMKALTPWPPPPPPYAWTNMEIYILIILCYKTPRGLSTDPLPPSSYPSSYWMPPNPIALCTIAVNFIFIDFICRTTLGLVAQTQTRIRSLYLSKKGTILLLRQYIFGLFLTHPPTRSA